MSPFFSSPIVLIMSNAATSNSVRTVDGVIRLSVKFCGLRCGRFGGYVVTCDWWWAYSWEHTVHNRKYIILFSIDTKGHAIRGGHNGGYD